MALEPFANSTLITRAARLREGRCGPGVSLRSGPPSCREPLGLRWKHANSSFLLSLSHQLG
jgi:hypothetical protein